MFVRTRFQYGSLRLRKRERSTDVWEFRYYETSPVGKRIRQSVILGDQALYRTEADARKATQALLMRLNDEAPRAEMEAPTFGALLDRYIEHELPERHSTQRSHLSNIRKHIRPRWSDQPINRMKPMAMEQWLRDLPLAPKSKVHIRSLMHLVMKCAERWGVIEIGKNPVALVRVKNASKRLKRPQILEVAQFFEMLKHLAEPYRTMVMVAQCTGLRISEILGLQWGDFDFEAHTFMVQRSVVSGRVDAVKTEYSKDYVPLDPRLEGLLLGMADLQRIFQRCRLGLRQSADREALPPGEPQEASTPPGCRTHRPAGRDRVAYVPPHLPFLAGRDRRSHEGATGADATRLHPDDDEHLWTGDERLQTQSQQPGRWAGIRRNDGIEKGRR
jgi:integrase